MFLNKILQAAIINQAVGIWMENYCHLLCDSSARGMSSFINLELDKPSSLYAANWSFPWSQQIPGMACFLSSWVSLKAELPNWNNKTHQ